MAATPEVLKGRSSARREVLAVRADEVAGTVEEFLSGTLEDLGELPTGATATRETLAATTTATREDLSE